MGRARVWVLVAGATGGLALVPSASSAATCSQYSNQAAAQRAADTRDADGDGVYCESLPCPCASAGSAPAPSKPKAAPKPKAKPKATGKSCSKPTGVQRVRFAKAKYPNIRKHFLQAVGLGWPRILVINRPNADRRRDRLLHDIETQAGFDRDEYPPAVGRGRGSKSLTRGINPIGWMADVMYVESRENQAHGSSLGGQLRRFCNGTRFRYVFF
jgi:hypothetical protein